MNNKEGGAVTYTLLRVPKVNKRYNNGLQREIPIYKTKIKHAVQQWTLAFINES